MKLKNTIFILMITGLTLSSCTEIIDIDINSSDPEIVVEATIGENEFAEVAISRSIGLNEAVSFQPVENATVTISDQNGNRETLTEITAGIYVSTTLVGETGKKYSLQIQAGEHNISSVSTIPGHVPIDSFKVENSIYPGGGPPVFPGQKAPFYEIKVNYTDPVNEKNYYRFILYVNDKPQPNNYIYDDRLTNGNAQETFMIIYNENLGDGDKIKVEMQCIDKLVYDYFSSISNAGGGPGGSSTPANPYTNLTGTVLGYFSAHTVERKEFELE